MIEEKFSPYWRWEAARIDKETITATGRAPQSVLAGDVLKRLASFEEEEWERCFWPIISAVRDQEELDPFLKAVLLTRVLDVACEGSHVFEVTFAECRKILSSRKLDPTVNWLDPADEDAQRVRKVAAEALAALPEQEQIDDRAKEAWNRLRRPGIPSYVWVGWLAIADDSHWEFLLKDDSMMEYELGVVLPGDDPAWRSLPGRRFPAMPARSGFRLGQPVFAKVPPVDRR